jgi:hypothetical protein
MVAGVAFALLVFFGASSMFSSTPETKKSDTAAQVAQKWATWIGDSGHRDSVIVGSFLLVLAAIALIWFASAIRGRLTNAGSPLMGFAVLAAVGLAAGTAGPLALVGGHAFGSEPLTTDGNVIWLLFVVFGLGCSAFIATVLVTGRGVLPMWLVVSGWIAVVAGLLGILFITMVVVLLWFLAAGIYGAVRPDVAQSTASG